MPNLMSVKFEEGKKVITHPSGVVSVYTKEHIDNFRSHLI
jgi:hypothetical protein